MRSDRREGYDFLTLTLEIPTPDAKVTDMETTRDNITTDQITALRAEAAAAGDHAAVIMCDAALDGDETAIDGIVQMVRNAEAMED